MSKTGLWKSVHDKEGAHYNTFTCRSADGMTALRSFFPDGKANDLNFALFSTSGVHGSYVTIEEAEAEIARGNKDEDGEETPPQVTFLIIQPRVVCMRYGMCEPKTVDDIAYLKALRASSWEAAAIVGRADG